VTAEGTAPNGGCEACEGFITQDGTGLWRIPLPPTHGELAERHHALILDLEERNKDLALLLAEAVELIRSSGDAPTHSKEFGCRACEKETAWMKRADDLEDRAERALGGKA